MAQNPQSQPYRPSILSNDWFEQPIFDFLQPPPWSKIQLWLLTSLGVMSLGLGFGVLAKESKIKMLAMPAKCLWLAGGLATLISIFLTLPRAAKFFILLPIIIILLIIFVLVGTEYIFTGEQDATKTENAPLDPMVTEKKDEVDEAKKTL